MSQDTAKVMNAPFMAFFCSAVWAYGAHLASGRSATAAFCAMYSDTKPERLAAPG